MKAKTIFIIVGVIALILIIANWNNIFAKKRDGGRVPFRPKPGVGGGGKGGPMNPGVNTVACVDANGNVIHRMGLCRNNPCGEGTCIDQPGSPG